MRPISSTGSVIFEDSLDDVPPKECEAMYSALYIAVVRSLAYFCADDLLHREKDNFTKNLHNQNPHYRNSIKCTYVSMHTRRHTKVKRKQLFQLFPCDLWIHLSVTELIDVPVTLTWLKTARPQINLRSLAVHGARFWRNVPLSSFLAWPADSVRTLDGCFARTISRTSEATMMHSCIAIPNSFYCPELFDKRPNQIRPLGLRIKTDLSAIGFKQKDIFTSSVSTVPPWLLKPPSVHLSLSNFAKAETIPEVFKSKYLEICDRLQGFCQIYTDGSKTHNGTAAAAVSA